MVRRILSLTLLCFATVTPTFSQTLDKYSYRREVTIQTLKGNKVTSTLVRKSFFTFDDSGRRVESEIQVSGKSKLELTDFDWRTFRDAQIVYDFPTFASRFPRVVERPDIWNNDTHRGTLWKRNPDIVNYEYGDTRFPVYSYGEGIVKGRRVRLTVSYSDYRLFRTSVVLREVSE